MAEVSWLSDYVGATERNQGPDAQGGSSYGYGAAACAAAPSEERTPPAPHRSQARGGPLQAGHGSGSQHTAVRRPPVHSPQPPTAPPSGAAASSGTARTAWGACGRMVR